MVSMISLKTSALPFAVLLELCGEHNDDAEPPTGPDMDTSADAATSAASSDAGIVEHPDAPIGSDVGAIGADATAVSQPSDAGVLRAPPGLYADDDCQTLARGVRPYAPRFELWADGASKERFVFIPEGASIDASDPDLWTYPVGMRLYKTFAAGELKLETRIIEKTSSGYGPDAWSFRAYAWLQDQSGVELVTAGRADVLGTGHNIPSLTECRSCHSAAGQDGVNSFAAIQLNHDRAGVSLARLLDEGSLISPLGSGLLEVAAVPGNTCAQTALGYLHANCGNCHGGPNPRASMTLRLSVGQTELEATASTVGQPLQRWTGRLQTNGEPITLRVAPGSAAASGIIARMSARSPGNQMPPIDTEVQDSVGIATVSAWVDSL
jgi:hypothetical protein